MKEILEETIKTMKPLAESRQISLTLIYEDLPDVFIDSDRIKQVLDNLINNAIKFSPNGSSIFINTKKNNNEVVIEVQDEGIGIPEDKQKKIFEPFYQIDSGIDRSFGGTGLGLSICRGIILGHGGKIGVKSNDNKGSIFYFTIPKKSNLEEKGFFKKIDIFNIYDDNIEPSQEDEK
jgi:signal transduction histidine kinase